MSALKKLLEKLPPISSDEGEVWSDKRYIRRSSELVTDALKRGNDVMQMPNGDVIVTEMKPVTFMYSWNEEKGRFERATNGRRVKRKRKSAEEKEAAAAIAKAKATPPKKQRAAAKKELELAEAV